jgi:hypothetical protein
LKAAEGDAALAAFGYDRLCQGEAVEDRWNFRYSHLHAEFSHLFANASHSKRAMDEELLAETRRPGDKKVT